ncbi:hypothetical protein ACF0H5_017339 [Mactra antiquata]
MMALRRMKRTHKILLLCVGFIVLFLLLVTPDLSYGEIRSTRRSLHVLTFPNVHYRDKPVKRILKWTGVFKRDSTKSDLECLKNCSARCELILNRANIRDADAVHFHLSDLWSKVWRIGTKSIIDLPKYRTPDQVWILGNMEPPPHLWGNIKVFNGLFNWTNWYRLDSDVMWPYGGVYKLSEREQKEAREVLNGRNFFKEKTKEIVVRTSNCFDPGQRYRMVSKLSKYLEVDGFGKCYNRLCGKSTDPMDTSCDDELKQYKFYLAFENDLCRDYITEKYWLTLQRDQIPIVNWKFFDKSAVIPNSYINIQDFDSFDKLVKYLKLVSSNETLYNSYFEYKKYYKNHRTGCHVCDLCKTLHDKDKPGQIYVDMDGWVREDTCDKVELWNNFMKNVFGWRFYFLGF